MPFNIVVPSSRGLSLALARRLLQTSPHPLIATARSDLPGVKSRILEGLSGIPESRVTVLRVDVTDESTLASAASYINSTFPGDHISTIFSTPGILVHPPERSPSQLNPAHVRQTLETNLLGPLLILKHFSPFLVPAAKRGGDGGGAPRRPAAVWANVSARVGSIGDNRSGGWYSYRASKAGLNAVTKSFDLHLRLRRRRRRGSGDDAAADAAAVCVSLHPGTVRTELSREFWDTVPEGRLFEPEFAAERLVEVVDGLRVEDGGGFYDWKGERVEW